MRLAGGGDGSGSAGALFAQFADLQGGGRLADRQRAADRPRAHLRADGCRALLVVSRPPRPGEQALGAGAGLAQMPASVSLLPAPATWILPRTGPELVSVQPSRLRQRA